MYLLFAVGFFFFVLGLVQFLWNLEEGGKRQEGIEHMKWGIAGMLIMVSFQGIIMLLDSTFDLRVREGPDIQRVQNIRTPNFL